MLHFKSLRLNGFKSFIEKTDLEIGVGLTGIVGPNGCGKSNLVEALRWTMGESSAKKMRGGGMEDVIFAGTEKRPARNFAEVVLTLDNAAKSAPSPYNHLDDIEISRKIVKDQGSAYRINGRPARAKDVQMLFADTLSGANSPALVSQGKVASIINAKPLQRRMILEESAGITGLYARRHEAEMRLKQAETNLTRIEDTTGSMESRLSALKRQSRQAAKYKKLSHDIRDIDRLIAYLEWKSGEELLTQYRKEFDVYENIVAEQMSAVTQLNKTYLTQVQDLPKLRENEAKISAHVQKYRLDLQRIENLEAQRAAALQDATKQDEQLRNDIAHSTKELTDYKSSLTRTIDEQAKIQSENQQNEGVLTTRKDKLKKSEINVKSLEEKYNTAMTDHAARVERQKSLQRQISDSQSRLERLTQKIDQQKERQNSLQEQQNSFKDIDASQKEFEDIQKQLLHLEEALVSNKEAMNTQQTKISEARAAHQEASIQKSKLESEINTLKGFIDTFSEDGQNAVLTNVKAENGFEAALSRALGDTLQASLDESDMTYWSLCERKITDLPKGIPSLKKYIDAPKALDLALSQIGYVENSADGPALLKELSQGQSLVSKEGHYWRWDGFCMKAEAQDKQANFLKQKNLYLKLEKDYPKIEGEIITAAQNLSKLEQHSNEIEIKRDEQIKEKNALEQKRQELDKQISADKIRQENWVKEIESVKNTLVELEADKTQIVATLNEQEALLSSIQDIKDQNTENDVLTLKQDLDNARLDHQNNISAMERIQAQQNSRKAREHALADERVTLQNRIIRGEEHLNAQTKRLKSNSERLQELNKKPVDNEDSKDAYLSKISELEAERLLISDQLSGKEAESQETSRALKQAESLLGDSRENRARVQALYESAHQTQKTIVSRIEERFETEPLRLLDGLKDIDDFCEDTLDLKREERQALLREREAIGPVNLQAEQEADDLEKDLGGLLHEKNDLIAAVDELRGAIKKLNLEARARLNSAFEHVNAHFQNLFKRLFMGGQAHLSLVDSDDPLDAGLEIFAQPPGKALQALSLMSGGEQTMASIALIFAMFLTNPAPICVLDEIDAPLDDANVDKVCDLLEEIAETTKTRFLVVSHHRLTMARMHRIYGVTMAEKGVSQLVSLDMQQSFGFLEEAA